MGLLCCGNASGHLKPWISSRWNESRKLQTVTVKLGLAHQHIIETQNMSVLTIALNKFFKKHVFPLVLCSALIVLKIQNHKIHSFVKTIFFSRLSAFALKLHFFLQLDANLSLYPHVLLVLMKAVLVIWKPKVLGFTDVTAFLGERNKLVTFISSD